MGKDKTVRWIEGKVHCIDVEDPEKSAKILSIQAKAMASSADVARLLARGVTQIEKTLLAGGTVTIRRISRISGGASTSLSDKISVQVNVRLPGETEESCALPLIPFHRLFFDMLQLAGVGAEDRGFVLKHFLNNGGTIHIRATPTK